MNESAYQGLDELLHKCLHCGLCLPVCPTYSITMQEQSSPRGRIRLMKSVHEGSLEISDQFVDEMYFCLDCQACQTACPAGVHYGELLEDSRNVISESNREPLSLRLIKSLLLNVLKVKFRTKFVAKLMRLYQRSGLCEAVDESGILGLVSDRLQTSHSLMPSISNEFFDEMVEEVVPARGERKGSVAFLSGCIMNVAFAEVHRDAVELLTKIGYEVVIPKHQQCCGSLHGHYGMKEEAKILARKNIELFERYNFDALIVDASGCSAFLKEYGNLLSGDTAFTARARAFSEKVKDSMEFFPSIDMNAQMTPLGKCVTYHEACHLVHTQKISQQPRTLLQSIPGAEFVELPEAAWCCGSAGIYNVVRTEDSMKFLKRKIDNLATTGADIVMTSNPGCHLQLQQGIKQRGLAIEVHHPVSVLNKIIS